MVDFSIFPISSTFGHTSFALKEALTSYSKDPSKLDEEMIEYLSEPFLDSKDDFELFYAEVTIS